MINEIEKILDNFVASKKPKNPIRITLPDVRPIDVEDMKLDTKVRYSLDPIISDRKADDLEASKKALGLTRLILSHKYLPTDSLFLSIMDDNVLSRLVRNPEYLSPSVRLLICDSQCYNLFAKLNRIVFRSGLLAGCHSNFLHKSPFDIAAVLVLSDVVAIFESQDSPWLFKRLDQKTGRTIYSFNYSLVRQTFPYLKMSDLFVFVGEMKQLDLSKFDPAASREDLTIKLLNQFAHSCTLIDLSSMSKLLVQVHPIYNNVVIMDQPSSAPDRSPRYLYDRLSGAHLISMAEQIVTLAEASKLRMTSICYRAADPFGQTKALSQLISTNLESRTLTPEKGLYGARVLVIDRFHNIANALSHADRFGPYQEQEKPVGRDGSRLKTGTTDQLGELIQLVPLTQVLSTIIKYSLRTKPQESSMRPLNEDQSRFGGRVNMAMLSQQSIGRHLDAVQSIYESLNDGYLLVLRLESTIKETIREVKLQPDSAKTQEMIALRVQRIFEALNQLMESNSKSIRALDLVRVACILLNCIDKSLTNYAKTAHAEAISILSDIRKQLLSSEFKRHLKSICSDSDIWKPEELLKAMSSFNSLLMNLGAEKANEQTEEIIADFVSQKLDSMAYPNLRLSKLDNDGEVLIVVFLGSITPQELGLLKSAGEELGNRREFRDMFIVAAGLAKPDDFMRALV